MKARRQSECLALHASGFSLVEVLISLALMSFVCLSIANGLILSNARLASLDSKFTMTNEVSYLISDLQQDFRKGAYISSNSYDQRLEYTTYDSSGNATKKIYRITTISNQKYLQLSTDGGTTWISPYRISAYNKYTLTGSPKFLYAWPINNCTDFADTNGNGVWLSGSDSAGTYLSCSSGTSSPALGSPSEASKIDLQGFQFSAGGGPPATTRTLPTDLFISTILGPVRSTTSPASPAVKDPPLVQKFDTATANSLFGTAFSIRQAYWDTLHERLILVGNHTSGNHTFFVTSRQGVIYDSAFTTATTTIQANSAALESDNATLLLLDSTANNLYTFSLTGTNTNQATGSTLSLSSLITSPKAIAYDLGTSSDFYIVGTDPSDSKLKIFERNISSGALVGTAWTLPAAFDSSHPPGGLAIEPNTGDFLVVRNYVNGSSPNHTIDIYRLTRSGTSTSFSVNIDDLGSSATGTSGSWGLGYDPVMNRLFLSDSVTNKVYEVVPSTLISPRS